MRIAIYARKSTEREDRQVQSLEDQIRELKNLAKRDGFAVAEVFLESHSAKDPGTRPEFKRLMEAVEQGSVGAILTWSINRLSRNMVDGGLVAHLLQTGKLSFIQTIDRIYRPEDNSLLIAIENAQATNFVRDLKRDVARGLNGKFERGWHPCKAPVGYKNDRETSEIVPDPERFELVRRAWVLMLAGYLTVSEVHRDLVARGLTVRCRERSMPPISLGHLHTLLRDRFYMGEVWFMGRCRPGKHLPMVTEEEFILVQARLRDLGRAKKPARRNFLFGGIFRCDVCGCAVVGELRRKHYPKTARTAEYIYYHCSGAKGCSKKAIREEILVERASAAVFGMGLNEKTADWLKDTLVQAVEREATDTSADLALLERRRIKEEAKLQELALMRADGEVTQHEHQKLREVVLTSIASLREHANQSRSTATRLLAMIYQRVDAALIASGCTDQDRGLAVLCKALQTAGDQHLNLETGEMRLNPILEKITSFEPLRNSSEQPKRGDNLPINSVWLALVEDLRTAGTVQILQEDFGYAKKQAERDAGRAERRILREHAPIGQEMYPGTRIGS